MDILVWGPLIVAALGLLRAVIDAANGRSTGSLASRMLEVINETTASLTAANAARAKFDAELAAHPEQLRDADGHQRD